MSVSFEQFLTKEDFTKYEDSEKFNSVYLPKLKEYRKALEDAVLPEYSITLPDTIENLADKQFNPLKYLYDEKLLTEKELAITDSSAVKLVEKMSKGEYSAVEVFKAYAKRATICHQFTNCALQLFTDEGLKRAEELDEYYKKNGKIIGPLHGVPISLKEQMNYKGKPTHACYVSKIDAISEEHGVSTTILEKLGAVFYVRTNQPQTLMHLDSNNNFVGFSKNPHNLALSSGGSSSGEGSIVGFGGSAIGVGSDIGGSIRGPAAFSGCHGLRPTSKRIALLGGLSGGAGQESVMAVQGPMTRSIEDIDYYMKNYINEGKPWLMDQNALRMPWREVAQPDLKDITIAVLYDDGICKPTPPMARGLKETADKLEAAGAKIVKFEPIESELLFETVNKMYTCDGNEAQRTLLAASGEPLTKLTKWSLNFGNGGKALSVYENRKLNMIRDSLRQQYTKFMVDNKIDFILSPSYNNVAPRPEAIYNWSYTALFNLLDFPTLAFQSGVFQDPKVDVWEESHKDYKYRSDLEELELTNYKPEDFVGAPVGLQLSGLRYYDEEVVAAGKAIVEAIGADLYKLY